MNGWASGAVVAATAATLVAVVGTAGVIALRGPLARLHGAALVSTVAALLFGAAVCLHEGFAAGTAKGLLAVWIVVSGSAALTRASAASIRDWRTRRHRS